jgi:hypothetical protein
VRFAREPLTHRAVDDDDDTGRLGGDADAVRVEGRIEHRRHGGDDHREVLRPAAGEHRARRDAVEGGLPVRRWHGAERGLRPAISEHRIHSLRSRRNDRQPVRESPLEHVLRLVEAAHLLRLDRPGAASGLAVRPLSGEPHTEQSLVLRPVPPHETLPLGAVGIEQHGGRDRLHAELGRRGVRPRLRQHRRSQARTQRKPRGVLGRLLGHHDDLGLGDLDSGEVPERERGGRAVGVGKHEQHRAAGGAGTQLVRPARQW